MIRSNLHIIPFHSLICSQIGSYSESHKFSVPLDNPFPLFFQKTDFCNYQHHVTNTPTTLTASTEAYWPSTDKPMLLILSKKTQTADQIKRHTYTTNLKTWVPVQSGGWPVQVPLVVQCLVVRPEVLKPSQQAYATELPKVIPSLSTILPWAGVPGFPHDTAGK